MKAEVLKTLGELRVSLDRLTEVAETLPDEGPMPSISPHFSGQLRFWKPDKAAMAALFGADGWSRERCSWRSEYDWVKTLPNGVEIVLENVEVPAEASGEVDPAMFQKP